MSARESLFAGLVALLAIACGDQEPPEGPSSGPSSYSISDAAHNPGNEHFFFLPPMVPQPTFSGTFDGFLAPVAQICDWSGTACTTVVATFTSSSGPGSETVRVVPEDEHYIVNWHTDQFNLDPAKTYRIRVLVDGTELGYADVDVVSTGRELKNVQPGEFIPLLNGRTLPIKFRIEEGAIPPPPAEDFWQQTGFPDQGPTGGVTALAVNASDDLFAAVSGGNVGTTGPGVFRSTDNGATWIQLNTGLTNTNTKDLVAAANGDIYVGTHGDGVFRSTNNGASWVQTALTGRYIQVMFASGTSMYALDGFFCTGVYRSTDNGATWTTLNTGLARCVNDITVNVSGHLFVATGTSGAFRSTNDGASWNPINSGLGSLDLRSIVVAPNGDVYAGTVGAGVFRSTDNGDSWTAVNAGLPKVQVQVLDVSPVGHLWLGLVGAPGAYRSVDNGATWTPVSSGLNSTSPNGIGADVVFQATGNAVVSDGQLIWRSRRSALTSMLAAAIR